MRLQRKSAPLRVVCYAVNGLGLGHITRLTGISREMRRLAQLIDLPIEISFLTTSEGDSIAALHDFPSFKIPSRTVIANAGFDRVRYRKLARQWIWNAMGMLSPDLLLVDTFPAGVFDELLDVLDFGQKNVFIYRAVRASQASLTTFSSAMRAYDVILKPGEPGRHGNDSPVPNELAHRVVPLGSILLRSRGEMLSRDEARSLLGLPGDGVCVYVTVGGGGDPEAARQYQQLSEMAGSLPTVRFVFGVGTLYTGQEWYQPNIQWTRRPIMAIVLPAFDAAITAGGYNSVAELMHAGIPCVFLPQVRTHDDQKERVDRCVEQGAGIIASDVETATIINALRTILDEEKHDSFARAAGLLVPINAATRAAEESLSTLVESDIIEYASDLRDAFVEQGCMIPDGWTESEFMLAFGRVGEQMRSSDADDVAVAALEATQERCRLSIEQGQTARDVIRSLRAEVRDGNPAIRSNDEV